MFTFLHYRTFLCVVKSGFRICFYGLKVVILRYHQKFFFMGVIKDADYEIEFHRLCRSILLAVRKFKMSTGVERCCVETTDSECDEELDESSGKFLSPGRKLGITVFVDEDVDSDDDDDE